MIKDTMPEEGPSFLFVLPWEPHHPGGVNQVVQNLMYELSMGEGVRPLLMVQRWPCEGIQRQGDFFTTRLRHPWSAAGGLRSLMAFVMGFLPTWRLWHGFLRQQQVALINIHYPSLSGVFFAVLRRSGLFSGKLVLSLHGLDLEGAIHATGVERALWRFLLVSADHVVCCSHQLTSRLQQYFPQAHAQTIHNGINPQRIDEEMRHAAYPEGIPQGAFLFSVGTFETKKGQDNLVAAFAQIAPSFPDINLVLAGRMGPSYAPLVAQVAALGLSSRVVLRVDMPHGEVMRLMEQAQLFVLPSRIEPFGIVLLEAGLLGVPVIATRTGGIPEIIHAGDNGELVEVDNVADLAQQLEEVLRHPDQARQRSERLRHDVLTSFTWHRATQEYLAFLG